MPQAVAEMTERVGIIFHLLDYESLSTDDSRMWPACDDTSEMGFALSELIQCSTPVAHSLTEGLLGVFGDGGGGGQQQYCGHSVKVCVCVCVLDR